MKKTTVHSATPTGVTAFVVLLEAACALLCVAALKLDAGMPSYLLAGGALAAMAATLAAHARVVAARAVTAASTESGEEENEDAHKPAGHASGHAADAMRAQAEGARAATASASAPAQADGDANEATSPAPSVAVAAPQDAIDASAAPPASVSRLDVEALSDRLTATADPIAELRLFVNDIRRRARAQGTSAPSPFELFAARALEEADVLASDVELPSLRVVRPAASQMFYLRIGEERLPYLAKVRVLAIEAALNAIRLSNTYFDDANAQGVEDHYRLMQSLTASICAQSPNLAERVPVIDDARPDSEWAVRMGISTAIESMQLPHRLAAEWRVNVADGNVAIELELTPEAVFPKTSYVDGIGLVPSTREMRRHAASDYALRLALLVAACAFRCSERIRHVWVAGIYESATRRDCYLSVDFDRWRFARLDLADLGNLAEVYHLFAPQLRYDGAILRPVRQTFSFDQRRFCPPWRYESVDLSNRRLADDAAASLGTDHVSGLAINEGDKRRLIAGDIMRRLTASTTDNVHAILELAADDPDLSVRAAAERTVTKLIDGTLDDEPLAVVDEFVSGDELSRAVALAQQALVAQSPYEATRILRAALAPLDAAGTYADSPTIEWRYFPSYVNRAMYNRLCSTEGRTLMLVPDAYFEAHLLLSAALLALGEAEEALAHARRLVELSPLDARARLHATRCLETLGKQDEAVDMLADLLATAHDPYSLGFGYYRMAFFQWQRSNLLAAQACYQRALRFMPGSMPLIAMELATLVMQNPGSVHEGLSAEEGEDILQSAGIPVAPTEVVSETFLDAARASLDAEVFPVAKNFVHILGAFSGDDILMGLIRSIEEEPDF